MKSKQHTPADAAAPMQAAQESIAGLQVAAAACKDGLQVRPVGPQNHINEVEMQPGGALRQPLLRIPMDSGNVIEWERRTSGRSGWLLRAGDGQLIRALTVAEVELVDASIAAAQAVAIASDTCAQMRALCSACGGTGDVHRIDGEWLGQCNCVHAWQLRAERAEADLAQANEWRAAALADSQQSGERWAQRVAELEAQLARRRAPLSPETQQAIAAARAAGQSIAATPAGLVFMNDGTEPHHTDLDCPACGGSGHVADTPGGSTP